MAANYVIGDSSTARGLKDLMGRTVTKLEGDIGDMEKAVKNIHGAWNDDGAGEFDEILSTIKKALQDVKEAMPIVEKSLEAYAVFLETR